MKFTGADIAAAFNRPNPDTKCANCPHARWRHRRVITKPGMFDGEEEHYECQSYDRRTTTNRCKCEAFTEPAPVALGGENRG